MGLEKIIERRVGHQSMGFRTDQPPVPAGSGKRNIEILEQIQPIDLIKYGLIPEFVGRLPVVGVLNDLDAAALVEILTRPKNSLVRQYQRLFEFENVRLRFTDGALELDLMYHLPGQRKLREFAVTEEMVKNHEISFNATLLEKAG